MPPFEGDLGPHTDRVLDEANAELWRYLSRAAEVAPGSSLAAAAAATGLTSSSLRTLGTAHYLLSDEVRRFVEEGAPKILRRIARSTDRAKRVAREVRGAIDWPATLSARTASGWTDPVFVCHEPYPETDLPQNRLVKHELEHIRSLAMRVISDEQGQVELSDAVGADAVDSWLETVARRGSRAESHLKSPYLQGVTITANVTGRAVRAARRDRNRGYHDAAETFRLRRKLLEIEDPEALITLLRQRLLVPARPFRLLEIWALARLGDALRSEWGEPEHTAVLNQERGSPAYRFRTSGGGTASVYFQSLPATLREASEYSRIFEAYSLDVASRLPDLVLEVEEENERSCVVFEVKASRRNGYLADGLYKLLGYVSDFERALSAPSPDTAAAVLLGVEGIDLRDREARRHHSAWITTVERFDDDLEILLAPLFD